MHFKWKYDPPTPEQKKDAEKLIDNLKVSPVIATIMAKRGIKEEDAKKFFHPQLNDLIDPFLMKDMDAAVERLNEAWGARNASWCMVTTMWTDVLPSHWFTSSYSSITPTSTTTFPTATTRDME